MANTIRNMNSKNSSSHASTRGGTHEQHVEAGRKGGLAAHSSRGGGSRSEGSSQSSTSSSRGGSSRRDSE